jgi:hypothetical protein
MSKRLSIDEMLECLFSASPNLGIKHLQKVEQLANELAADVRETFKIEGSSASFKGTMAGGTWAIFWPSYEGQRCPSVLEDYDPGIWKAKKKI